MSTIRHRRSSVSGKVPTTAQLVPAELAINTTDGQLFFRTDTTVKTVVSQFDPSHYVGSNLLVQGDGTNGFMRTINNGGTLFLGASNQNTISITPQSVVVNATASVSVNTPTLTVTTQDDQAVIIEVGPFMTAPRASFIDFHGDFTYTDYALRVGRDGGGPNAGSRIEHRGTGGLLLNTLEAGYIHFATQNQIRGSIAPDGSVAWNQPWGIGVGNSDLAQQLTLSSQGAAGAGLQFYGNGSTTPKKWIRAIAGNLQVVNNAYSNVIFDLSDGGNLRMTGEIVAPRFTANASGVALRMKDGDGTSGIATMLYSDQGDTYFLLTNSGDANGGFNSLRPLHFNKTSGLVSTDNGLNVANGLGVSGGSTISGGLNVISGPIGTNGGFVSNGGNGGYHFRMKDGATASGQAVSLYSDTGSFYFLLSDPGNADGTDNGKYPFIITKSTGRVSMQRGVTINNGLSVLGGITSIGNYTHFRMKDADDASGIGAMLYSDTGFTYILLTNNNDSSGGANSLRPLSINKSNGYTAIQNGLTVAGGIVVFDNLNIQTTMNVQLNADFNNTLMMRQSTGSAGMADATGGRGRLEVRNATSGPAMMTFHRELQHAVYFGLDNDNILKVGGWSLGNNAYTIIHSGNISQFAGTGAQGPAGPQGATGPQGPAGATGATGPAGSGGSSNLDALTDVQTTNGSFPPNYGDSLRYTDTGQWVPHRDQVSVLRYIPSQFWAEITNYNGTNDLSGYINNAFNTGQHIFFPRGRYFVRQMMTMQRNSSMECAPGTEFLADIANWSGTLVNGKKVVFNLLGLQQSSPDQFCATAVMANFTVNVTDASVTGGRVFALDCIAINQPAGATDLVIQSKYHFTFRNIYVYRFEKAFRLNQIRESVYYDLKTHSCQVGVHIAGRSIGLRFYNLNMYGGEGCTVGLMADAADNPTYRSEDVILHAACILDFHVCVWFQQVLLARIIQSTVDCGGDPNMQWTAANNAPLPYPQTNTNRRAAVIVSTAEEVTIRDSWIVGYGTAVHFTAFSQPNQPFVKLTNLEAVSFNHSYRGVVADNRPNIRIAGCSFGDMIGTPISLNGGVRNVSILDNKFVNCTLGQNDIAGVTIYVNACSEVTIDGNVTNLPYPLYIHPNNYMFNSSNQNITFQTMNIGRNIGANTVTHQTGKSFIAAGQTQVALNLTGKWSPVGGTYIVARPQVRSVSKNVGYVTFTETSESQFLITIGAAAPTGGVTIFWEAKGYQYQDAYPDAGNG